MHIGLEFVIMIAIGLTGCGKSTPNSTGTNTSSGTNPYGQNTNSNTPANLEKNISTSGAVTDLGKLIVFVTNNNSVAVDMEIEAEFYDANGAIVGSASEDLRAVGPNADIVVDLWSTPDRFDNYKIYVDVVQTEQTSYFDKVELVHNNTGKKIAAQVKNNSSDTIERIAVSVVYYQGDKVVGYEHDTESDIKPGRSANFNLNYPYNKNYRNVKFDNYKVFITEAYSYNW